MENFINCTARADSQSVAALEASSIVNIATAAIILSTCGAGFMVIAYVYAGRRGVFENARRSKRGKPTNQLALPVGTTDLDVALHLGDWFVFNLSLNSLLLSCSFLVGIVSLQVKGPDWLLCSELCRLQATLLMYCELSNLAWVCCLHYTVFQVIVRKQLLSTLEAEQVRFVVICYVFPIIPAVLPLSDESYGLTEDPWCWIVPNSERQNWRLLLHIPVFIILLSIPVILWKASQAASQFEDGTQPKKLFIKLRLYGVAFICCWLPLILVRVIQWAQPAPPGLVSFATFMIMIGGYINVIVYGNDTLSMQSIRKQMREFLSRLLPLESTFDPLSHDHVQLMTQNNPTQMPGDDDDDLKSISLKSQSIPDSTRAGTKFTPPLQGSSAPRDPLDLQTSSDSSNEVDQGDSSTSWKASLTGFAFTVLLGPCLLPLYGIMDLCMLIVRIFARSQNVPDREFRISVFLLTFTAGYGLACSNVILYSVDRETSQTDSSQIFIPFVLYLATFSLLFILWKRRAALRSSSKSLSNGISHTNDHDAVRQAFESIMKKAKSRVPIRLVWWLGVLAGILTAIFPIIVSGLTHRSVAEHSASGIIITVSYSMCMFACICTLLVLMGFSLKVYRSRVDSMRVLRGCVNKGTSIAHRHNRVTVPEASQQSEDLEPINLLVPQGLDMWGAIRELITEQLQAEYSEVASGVMTVAAAALLLVASLVLLLVLGAVGGLQVSVVFNSLAGLLLVIFTIYLAGLAWTAASFAELEKLDQDLLLHVQKRLHDFERIFHSRSPSIANVAYFPAAALSVPPRNETFLVQPATHSVAFSFPQQPMTVYTTPTAPFVAPGAGDPSPVRWAVSPTMDFPHAIDLQDARQPFLGFPDERLDMDAIPEVLRSLDGLQRAQRYVLNAMERLKFEPEPKILGVAVTKRKILIVMLSALGSLLSSVLTHVSSF